ncbi:hypothetical protein [Bradyrhizobium sp. CCGUVB23]|uniref:hypothetical protein n=1 Tax=Bradyrhizobium sp. CCGUVB23 TaxID=2949630 RepID=UPI0020B35A18|nr:hypothetical protein [Bradyrhizobium sp. CCGUVB23]MCP3460351.1 hypothetical protein [Bradyrhizobium sp. CCGUVB23]
MDRPSHLCAFRRILLSASSLTLVLVASASALAQNDATPQAPAVSPAPQPSASPTAEPAPPQGMATPAPSQPPAQTPEQQAPTTQTQPAGPNVLPETRVAAPVERRQPRTSPDPGRDQSTTARAD